MLLSQLRLAVLLLYIIAVEGIWIHKPGNLFVVKDNGDKHTLAWLVTLKKHVTNQSHVTSIASSAGLLNIGQVLWLKYHYFFVHPAYKTSHHEILNTSKFNLYHTLRHDAEKLLSQHDDVVGFHVEVFRKRSKRLIKFHDPKFKDQWYLVSLFVLKSNSKFQFELIFSNFIFLHFSQ